MPTIAGGLKRSTYSSCGRAALEFARTVRPNEHAMQALDLAPGGVYQATPVTWDAGALLPHLFTLTRAKATGGLFSVALARGSPRVAVSNHRALWSPDFPPRLASPHKVAGPTRRDHPAVSTGFHPTAA